MYDISTLVKEYKHPVLVQSVDGVGTKVTVARMVGDFSTIGEDLFYACANDIAVHGAKPLTFLDYIANDVLDARVVASIVKGIAKACVECSTSLVGGETAEMPGVYLAGEHDLVGLITGIVEKEDLIQGHNVQKGNAIIGIGSSGLHTNGFSLARKILFEHGKLTVDQPLYTDPSHTIGAALLKPHANYINGVQELLAKGAPILSMAHITGGGLVENVPRVIPQGLSARFYPSRWSAPPIFQALQQIGNVNFSEMYRTFNMGIGLVIIVEQSDKESVLKMAQQAFNLPVWEVGEIAQGEKTWIEGVTV
jgi:phosphoribosylformylglycinamidine cyclo-ligase